ncbi:efflux RND transporter periplasmic adaptor subunit [Coraliomargarita parva]|uniref:efflux RND transporter periplasmic adaptor subunit n=1 Tax=Coraliomargarita parva TaxID=3014050 RepID=UPI0022B4081B|nr:efflux RND transporter periplasmic adaptor subunit [Coraliomargarita parva]
MKRLLITFVILAVVAFGGYKLFDFVAKNREKDEPGIRTDTASVRDLESVVTATGEVLPLLSSVVKSEISGRITVIHVEEGESVEKDQVLLELDRTSLQTRVREAERSLQAEQLKLDKAKRNYDRLKALFAREFVGEQEFLDAQTDFELAQLNLEIAEARLEDAEDDLSKTTIIAPHDGVVTLLDVVDGEVISGATSVSNGTEILTIAELKELFMEAKINEVDVERLHLGQEARLRFDAIPDFSLKGKISVIALSARKENNVRVFPIEVVFEASDNRVRPGISATVDIPIDSVSDAVSVLLSAVFNDDEGESYVFVQKGEGWDRCPVEVGISDLQHVEIRSGLSEGDVVALSRPPEFRSND